MSMQAMTWVMTEAPVGADTRARVVLYALANFARPDGTGAYPSIATLVALSHLPKRTVQLKLAQLEANGVIRRGDQRIVAHIRADHRPVVRDLVMSEDLDESGMTHGLAAVMRSDAETTPGAVSAPRENAGRGAETAPRNGSRGADSNATGCRNERHGVQPTAPNPKDKPTNNPRESAREENIRIPEDWTPSRRHLLAARDLELDVTSEARSFRSYHQAKGDRMVDWDAAFDLWLRRGAEFKRRENPPIQPKGHVHTFRCEHVLTLLERDGESAQPDDLAVHLAMNLNQGMDPADALHALGIHEMDPLEEIA